MPPPQWNPPPRSRSVSNCVNPVIEALDVTVPGADCASAGAAEVAQAAVATSAARAGRNGTIGGSGDWRGRERGTSPAASTDARPARAARIRSPTPARKPPIIVAAGVRPPEPGWTAVEAAPVVRAPGAVAAAPFRRHEARGATGRTRRVPARRPFPPFVRRSAAPARRAMVRGKPSIDATLRIQVERSYAVEREYRSISTDITFEICAKSMFNRNIAFVCNTRAKSLFANRKAVDRRDFFPYSRAKWEKVG